MTVAADNRKYTGNGSELRRGEFSTVWNGPPAANQTFYVGTLAGAKTADMGSGLNPLPLYPFVGDGTMKAFGFVTLGAGQAGDTTYPQAGRPLRVMAMTGTLIDLNAGGGSALTTNNLWQPVYGVDNQTCSKLSSDSAGAVVIGVLAGIDPVSGQPVVLVDPFVVALLSGDLAPGSITTAMLAANAVTEPKLAATIVGEQSLSGAGAVDVTHRTTFFTSTGAGNALTIADGTVTGQRKTITHVVKGASGTGVLTPAHPSHFATYTFTNVHDFLELEWNGTGWEIVAFGGGTIA